MAKQDPERKSLKELIRTGAGLTDFRWPEHYIDFDIRILRDGTWTYRGSPIRRQKLCQLFATVLQRDDGGEYWLVTPGERGRIVMDDAPFTAVEIRQEQGSNGHVVLAFRTNLDYWVTADAHHPIRVEEDPESGEPSPYIVVIVVRDGLEALIVRSVFYDLVDLAEQVPSTDGVEMVVESAGQRFSLGRI